MKKNNKTRKSAFIVIKDTTLTIPLTNIIDTDNELKKLDAKMKKENDKLNVIQNKLKNKQFMEKAPQHIIEEFTIQENDIKSSIDKIKQIINTIN